MEGKRRIEVTTTSELADRWETEAGRRGLSLTAWLKMVATDAVRRAEAFDEANR